MSQETENRRERPTWVLPLAGIIALAAVAWAVYHFSRKPEVPPPVPEPPRSDVDETEESPLALDHAYVRLREHEIDKGTVHAFVRNTGDEPCVIKDVTIDGFSILESQREVRMEMPFERLSNPLVVWGTALPRTVPAGHVTDIMMRLRRRPTRSRTVIVAPESGTPLEFVLAPPGEASNAVRIDSITFSADLRQMYVYVNNTGTQAVSDPAFEVNNVAQPRVEHVWDRLAPDSKGVAVFSWPEPLERGRILNVKLTAAEKRVSQASIRAFSLFPISFWPHHGYENEVAEALNIDPEPFCVPCPKPGGDPELAAPTPATDESPNQAVYVYRDTTCRDRHFQQALGTNANLAWSRALDLYENDRQRAAFVHICLYRKIRSSYVYGEVLDFAAYTPFEVVGYPYTKRIRYSGNPLRNSYYARHAMIGAAPRLAIVNQHAGVLPEELRISVFSQIGEGVKGVLYSNVEQIKGDSTQAKALGELNRLLQQLRPYLRISAPYPMDSVTSADVRAYTLLAGDQGAVVVVVNEQFANRFPEDKNWVQHSGEGFPDDGGNQTNPAENEAAEDEGAEHDEKLLGGVDIDEVLALQRLPSEAGKKRAFRAKPKFKVPIKLEVPAVAAADRVVEVAADGQTPVDATLVDTDDGKTKVAFEIPNLATVKVYLITSDKDAAEEPE